MKGKIEKTNKKKILALAGKGEIDEKKIKELRKGWKRGTNKLNKAKKN